MFKTLTHGLYIDKQVVALICMTPSAGYQISSHRLFLLIFGLVKKQWHWNCKQAVLQEQSKKNAKLEKQAMIRLDLRNLIIPFCLLKASNVFRTLKKDDVLEILCSDTENLTNLKKILLSDLYELKSAKDI